MCSNLEQSFKVSYEGHSRIIWNILVWSKFRFHFIQSGSNLSHKVSMGIGCAVTLNEVSRSRVRAISNHAFIFLEHLHSQLSTLWLILLLKMLTMFQVKCEGHGSIIWKILVEPWHFPLPLFLSDSYLIHIVPMIKEYATT